MPEEIKKLLLYLKRSIGRYDFTESEILNVLSIRARYLSPDQVKEFLRIAVEQSCLKYEGERYVITCPINLVELSIDYKPNFEEIMNEKGSEDILDEVLRVIAENTKMSKREIVAEVNRMREKNPYLSGEVASLIVAKLNGVNVDKYL